MVAIQISITCSGGHRTPYFMMDSGISLACVFAIVLYNLCLHYRSLIISLSSSKSLFPRLWDPLAVDLDLPSGPSNPPKPNKTKHKTKNINKSPAHILDAWQRGGFREAYGDPPRCSTPWSASRRFRSRPLLSQAQAVACKDVT